MAKLLGLLATAASSAPSRHRPPSANRERRPLRVLCPGEVALTRADLAPARWTVLRFATHEFLRRAPDVDPQGAYAGRALRGPAWAKGGFINAKCGRQVWRRTAVVGVTYPAMIYSDPTAPGPCKSCAGIEFLASRTRPGWVVWYTL